MCTAVTLVIVAVARDRSPSLLVVTPPPAPVSSPPVVHHAVLVTESTETLGALGATRRSPLTSISATPVVDDDEQPVSGACIVAARAADAKSGEDTAVLAMGELLGLTDAFVITSGRNVRQVRSIVDEVELRVKASEGVRRSGWKDSTTPAGC